MAIYDLTTTIPGAKIITNLVNRNAATMSSMGFFGGIFTHQSQTTAMFQNATEIPVYGHKYYGRCYQKAPNGYTFADGRFEYYSADIAGTGLMTFATMRDTKGEWERVSDIKQLSGAPSGTSWVVRSFTVNGNIEAYRKEMLIVDLTATYGAGNEPSKEWCDEYIPYFEGSLIIVPELKKGDIINCPFVGSGKGVLLPAGRYQLSCWGAQGGSFDTTYTGGKGGYSSGEMSLKENTGVLLFSGGKGADGTAAGTFAGGFNGGGNGYTSSATYDSSAGGGGSDIRLSYDSYYARLIVAGGGGGAGTYDASNRHNGGAGGGESGESGEDHNSSYLGGTGGTATEPGISYLQEVANSTNNGDLAGFGFGGSGKSSLYISGGGGGWYGGGYGVRTAGGGGSGYIYTKDFAKNYPAGCLLTDKRFLKSGFTINGNTSFVSPDGSVETGHAGDGYTRIVVLDFGNIDEEVKIGDSSLIFATIGNKTVSKIYKGKNRIL